jgi:molybdenum cofactor biosynthesis enzyme MoaA
VDLERGHWFPGALDAKGWQWTWSPGEPRSHKSRLPALGEEFKLVTELAKQQAAGCVSVPPTQQHKGSCVHTQRERVSNRGTLHHRLARESGHQFPPRIQSTQLERIDETEKPTCRGRDFSGDQRHLR